MIVPTVVDEKTCRVHAEVKKCLEEGGVLV